MRSLICVITATLAASGCSTTTPAVPDAGGSGGNSGGTGGGSGGNSPPTTDANAADTGAPPDVGAPESPPAGVRPLNANDVSILFPRSGVGTAAALWPVTLEGNGGPLLPLATYMRIGRPVFFGVGSSMLAPAAEYAKLRVVAVRFDPCFGNPCQPQLRLVVQAVEASGGVADGAVHLLYNLTEPALRTLLGELRALTARAPENRAELPLGPSPALTAQGLGGDYGSALRALVTRHAGAGNLARLTFMTRTAARNGTWEFGGLNLKFFAPEGPLAIPGLPPATLLQTVVRPVASGEYAYVVTPPPTHLAALLPVIDAEKASGATAATRVAAHDVLARVENPTLESPDSADCVSCHVANRIRTYLDQHYPPAAPPAGLYAGAAEARRHVGGAEKDDHNLRAFGHFDNAGQAPVVSQRTANETHRVLQLFAAM